MRTSDEIYADIVARGSHLSADLWIELAQSLAREGTTVELFVEEKAGGIVADLGSSPSLRARIAKYRWN